MSGLPIKEQVADAICADVSVCVCVICSAARRPQARLGARHGDVHTHTKRLKRSVR